MATPKYSHHQVFFLFFANVFSALRTAAVVPLLYIRDSNHQLQLACSSIVGFKWSRRSKVISFLALLVCRNAELFFVHYVLCWNLHENHRWARPLLDLYLNVYGHTDRAGLADFLHWLTISNFFPPNSSYNSSTNFSFCSKQEPFFFK